MKVLMETSIRTYAGDGGIIVFEQKFPTTLTGILLHHNIRPKYSCEHWLRWPLCILDCWLCFLLHLPPSLFPADMIGISNFDYLSDRESNGNNTYIYSNAFGDLRGGGVPTLTGTQNACRVVTGDFKLTSSSSGYDSYEPDGSGGFKESKGKYCGEGTTTHAPSVYDGNLDQAACQVRIGASFCLCHVARFHHHN
jgi:hypothetical protein